MSGCHQAELCAVQSSITAIVRHQVGVAPLLNNAALVDDRNPVRMLDGGKPVGDDQSSPAGG